MKMRSVPLTICVAAAVLTATVRIRGADESAPKDNQSSPAALREKLKNMTPEERRAAVQEWRKQHPEAAARLKEQQNRREELRKITPEQRDAKIKERRVAFEKKAAELRKKKANETITGQESQQLERMEHFLDAGPRRLPVKDGNKRSESPADEAKPSSGK